MLPLLVLLAFSALLGDAIDCPDGLTTMTAERRQMLLGELPSGAYDCGFEKEMQARVDECLSPAPVQRPGRTFQAFDATVPSADFAASFKLMQEALKNEAEIGVTIGCGFGEHKTCAEGFVLMCNIEYASKADESTANTGINLNEGSGEDVFGVETTRRTFAQPEDDALINPDEDEYEPDKKGADADGGVGGGASSNETTTAAASTIRFIGGVVLSVLIVLI